MNTSHHVETVDQLVRDEMHSSEYNVDIVIIFSNYADLGLEMGLLTKTERESKNVKLQTFSDTLNMILLKVSMASLS